ncbi:MAG: sigma-70 family RNA polymerase sigma factor [Pirellulales bacterium]|nr:sigma-70 family RNA polymerase sigma factor [Pirellulales bacterium]
MSQSELFVELLTRHHQRIFLFILSLVPNQSEAEEILQETNLVLWRKFEEFEPGTNFKAWAFRVAYLKVQKYWERQSSDRLRFNEAFLQRVAEMAVEKPDTVDRRREALDRCLDKLPKKDRDMIRCRYRVGGSVKAAAEELGRTTHAIYKALARARRMLHDCVRVKLAMEERS